MATILGGEPEPLDALPVPKKNIFSVVARVNKAELLKHDWPGYGIMDELFPGGMPRRPGAVSIEELVVMGLGNQVGMHVYDASPMFDFNLPGFLGEMLGEFRGSGPGLRNEMLPVSFLVASLNSPVYLAVPVRDEKIVDKFLDELDETLAALARRKERGGWIDLDYDFYRVNSTEKGRPRRDAARGATPCGLGRSEWRLFFERIDGGLYIASQREILDDLAAAAKPRPAAQGPTAHAMVRVRPEHWKEVLPSFRLGWAEGSREACLNNLGSLGPVARALAASGDRGEAGRHRPRGRQALRRPLLLPRRRQVRGFAGRPRGALQPARHGDGAAADARPVARQPDGPGAQGFRRPDGRTDVPRRRPARGGDDRARRRQEQGSGGRGANDQPPAGPEKALQSKPVDAGDYCLIADALAYREQVDEAMQHYRRPSCSTPTAPRPTTAWGWRWRASGSTTRRSRITARPWN